MSALCVVDQVPATVGNLCTGCVTKLHATVLQVPRLLVELDVTITKQAKQTTPDNGGGTGGERGLVLNLAASEAAGQVRMWLRAVAHLTVGEGERVPVGIRDLAAWTARRLSVAARHPEIGEYHAGLLRAVFVGMRCIDRAPERRVIGVCDCGRPLATERSSGTMTCPHCRTEWVIDEWVSYRDGLLLDAVASTGELIEVLRSRWGYDVKRKTVESWVQRKQLVSVGGSPAKFRVGDVVLLHCRAHGIVPPVGDQEQGRAKTHAG